MPKRLKTTKTPIKIGVYKITSPSNKVYIGQSIDIEKRFKQYKRINGVKSQTILYYSLLKHGYENHLFEIIEICDVHKLNERERFWQEFYKVLDDDNGLNCNMVHTNENNGVMSEKTKEKIRKTKVGDKNPFFGKKHNKDFIDFKKTLTGDKNYNFGKKWSEEKKKERSQWQKNGYDNGVFDKKHLCSKVIDNSNGVVYDSIKEACMTTDYKYHTFVGYICGHRKNKTSFTYLTKSIKKKMH